jgi:hypothetical protein
MADEYRYLIDGISVSDVDEEMDKIWNDLQNPNSGIFEDSIEKGFTKNDLEQLTQNKRSELIDVSQDEAHLDPVLTAILIAVGTQVAKDIWTGIIFPRLKKRFGDDSIKENRN